jgi:hypothetical protein
VCKASVPDVLCEVRGSVSLFCVRCEVLCKVWGSVRGVYFCVRCSARGVEFCVRCSVPGMEFCVRCSA